MAVIDNGDVADRAPRERVMPVKGLVLLAAVAYDVWTKGRAGAAAR
jgi:putative multiple sugar transport system permease protein